MQIGGDDIAGFQRSGKHLIHEVRRLKTEYWQPRTSTVR